MKRLATLFLVLGFSYSAQAVVTSSTNTASFIGNGSTRAFPVVFKVLAVSDLTVTVNGVIKTNPTDYTVTLLTNSATVNFVVAPAGGTSVKVVRLRNLVQPQPFRNQGPLNLTTLENSFDDLEMQIQQLASGFFNATNGLTATCTGDICTAVTATGHNGGSAGVFHGSNDDGHFGAGDGVVSFGGNSANSGNATGVGGRFTGGTDDGFNGAGAGIVATGGTPAGGFGAPAAELHGTSARSSLDLTPQAQPTFHQEGDVYYDTAKHSLFVWTGSQWQNLSQTGVFTTDAFGMVCDGVTDEHVLMQAALNSAFLSTLILPCAKTCFMGSTGITVPGFKTVDGCGMQSSVIKCNGGSGACVTRDGTQGTNFNDFTIEADGASATLIGLLDTNASAASLRNSSSNLRIHGDQSPPTAGSIGHFVHSINSNSLYSIRSINETIGAFDKCVRALGDDGSGTIPPVLGSTGGSNDNHWTNPQIDNCVTGFSFEGYAATNTVQGLHCNGGGQAFDQLCLNLGDTSSVLVTGNKIDLYADNSVSGHIGRSYQILLGATRNEVRSFSGSSSGTNANSAGTDRNVIFEYNGGSGRSLLTVGNVQIFSDATTPGFIINVPVASNLPALLQNSSADVINAILWRIKANVAMTKSGAVLMEWNNPTTRMHAIDLNGADQFNGQTFANLGVPATPPNGTIQYCTDCTIANPCASGGTGAFAKRLNGVWVCN